MKKKKSEEEEDYGPGRQMQQYQRFAPCCVLQLAGK